MTNYELMTIAKTSLNDQGTKDLAKQVQDIITSLGGNVEKVDFWGKRKLAYEIRGSTEGFYFVMAFNADSSSVAKLKQKLNLIGDIVRYLISAKS